MDIQRSGPDIALTRGVRESATDAAARVAFLDLGRRGYPRLCGGEEGDEGARTLQRARSEPFGVPAA